MKKLFIISAIFILTISGICQQIDWSQIKNKPSFLGGPTAGDHIQYVSPFGNDLNDGLSWATAKLTCSAAVTAIGSNIGRVIESPALIATCIAGTGSSTNLNGQIISPTSLYLGPLAQATAIVNQNSQELRFAGSLWGPNPKDDFWTFKVAENSTALTIGSDFQLSHSSISNGAGRFSIFSDTVIQAPRAATVTGNSNSFAGDMQGAYFDGAAHNTLWEYALTTTPNSGSPVNIRMNYLPVFPDGAGANTADFCLGGTGTLDVVGNYTGAPAFCFGILPRDSFTANLKHSGWTANHDVSFPDAASNTIQPLAAPGDNKWVFYVDSSGVQQRTQPSFSAISGTATAAQVTAPGSLGQVVFNNTTLGADSNFFWDNTNKRLGIGTAAPGVPFHLKTTAAGGAMQMEIENTAAGGTTWFWGSTDNANGAGGGKFVINNTNSTGAARFTIDSATGFVGVNQTAPGSALDVNGTANVATSVTSPKMCLSANVCWTSGAGVPAGATCTTAKGGSLYSRTDGTTTTSLYVCDNGTGVWTAK